MRIDAKYMQTRLITRVLHDFAFVLQVHFNIFISTELTQRQIVLTQTLCVMSFVGNDLIKLFLLVTKNLFMKIDCLNCRTECVSQVTPKCLH